ncbi:hypothetical protein LSTR_LSTR016477 [Laodelphax striatellus]|uniref:Uncharacterized protein n=1 Tax=Laodelphax striatellus TaxID=195883 RepID=A0A482XH53_LAOST|nr:hypothetical protein LSTR_LSTR016477 [Laodelphax striatellus]
MRVSEHNHNVESTRERPLANCKQYPSEPGSQKHHCCQPNKLNIVAGEACPVFEGAQRFGSDSPDFAPNLS